MSSSYTRSGARRHGDDYQDVIVLDLMIDWLGHTDRYQWIEVEADDAGFLDDVKALKTDNTLVVIQVKYTVHPDDADHYWTWEKLLENPSARGKSLVEKWASSLQEVQSRWEIGEARVITNRSAPEIECCFSARGYVDWENIQQHELQQQIVTQIGSEADARAFFAKLEFRLNQPNLDEMEEGVRRRFFQLGGTQEGWLALKDKLRRWVRIRDEPAPNGQITLDHIRRAALWNQLRGLPQEFEIPEDYVLPSLQFHEEIEHQLQFGADNVLVLTASPGMGKSTYISYLYQQLRAQEIPVVRHHYSLSTSDQSSAIRLEYQRAAESLMSDLERDYPEALDGYADKNPHSSQLKEWLTVCGAYYIAQNKKLVVIIDGLDHVGRQRESIEELRELIELLAPVPPGVVLLLATQPVADDKLPRLILTLAPREKWIWLRPFDLDAVRTWTAHHKELLPRNETDTIFLERLHEIAEAFYRKSGGNPLYLKISVQALQQHELPITAVDIENLPGCPDNDIRKYYRELWETLSEESKSVLYLMAACQFPWPEQGIMGCLSSQNLSFPDCRRAFAQVKHLLKEDALGWKAFHDSMLVFIQELEDYQLPARISRQRTLAWLRQGDAPGNLIWGYEWIVAAELDDDEPLFQGPTRQWAVEAFSKRRSRHTMQEILDRSFQCAIRRKDLSRAFEIALLYEHTFYYNNYDFQLPVYETLLYAQLKTDSENLRHQLFDELRDISEGEISVLAEVGVSKADQEARLRDCISQLYSRLRQSTRYHSRTWQEIVYPLLRTAALPGGPPPSNIIDFAVRNRDHGLTVEMLGVYCQSLRIYKNSQALHSIIENLDDLEWALLSEEKEVVLQHGVLLALEENLDLDEVLDRNSVFTALYALVRQKNDTKLGACIRDSVDWLTLKSYEHREHSPSIWTYIYNTFFVFLVNHLLGHSSVNQAWLNRIGSQSWRHRFLNHLNTIAMEVGNSFTGSQAFSLGWFYERLDDFEKISVFPSNDEFDYIHAAAHAVIHIGLDLLTLNTALGCATSISSNELQSVLESQYCYPFKWIEAYTDNRRTRIDREGIQWLLDSQEKEIATLYAEFPERAEQYADLAAIAALHNLSHEAAKLVRLACENMITHGQHKDMLFFHVLESIVFYHQTLKENEEVRITSQKWVRQVAPAILHVEDYTDGDETGDLPRELADVLAEVMPEYLPKYYVVLNQQEEHYNAHHALHVFLKTADLSNPLNEAIAKTSVDSESLKILYNRATRGDANAQNILDVALQYFGERVLEAGQEAEPYTTTFPESEEKPPPISDYTPQQLREYKEELRNRHIFDASSHIKGWAAHWADQGQKREVCQSLIEDAEQNPYAGNYDTIFELVLSLYGKDEAYPWLVKAHVQQAGWERYFSSKELAVNRWQIIETHYPKKWFEFICDTISQKRWGTWSWYLSQGGLVRIVEYCLFMEQHKLARELIDVFVPSALEYISPLEFPRPDWISEE